MKSKATAIALMSIALISVWEVLLKLNMISLTHSRVLWLASIISFVLASRLMISDFAFESRYGKVVIYVFLGYQFISILRGLSLSTKELRVIFREPQIFWPLVVPLFVFFNKSYANIVTIIKTFYVFALCFLCMNIFWPSLLQTRFLAEKIIPNFALCSGFLLLNAKYLSNKRVNIVFIVLMLSTLSYVFLARRSSAFTLCNFIVFSYFLNYVGKSNKFIFKVFPVLFITALYLFVYPNQFVSTLLLKMKARLLDDSRTELFDSFSKQMEGEMAFGRGMNGTYYYPMEETEQDDGIIYGEEIYRNNIENGYLQLVLTGGLVNVALFLMVLLPACINGIFRSSNQFCRACGVMILLWLLDMFFYGLPILSLHYILIWICVGICYKPTIRYKTDLELTAEFRKLNLT